MRRLRMKLGIGWTIEGDIDVREDCVSQLQEMGLIVGQVKYRYWQSFYNIAKAIE